MGPTPHQPTLGEYLTPVKERRWLIVAITIVAAIAGAVVVRHHAKTYTAVSSVYLGAVSSDSQASDSLTASTQDVADQAELLTSQQVAAVVARRIGFHGSASALASMVSAVPTVTTDFIDITAQTGSSASAALIANAFAQELVNRLIDGRRNSRAQQIAAIESQLRSIPNTSANAGQRSSLTSQIQQIEIAGSITTDDPMQVAVATPPGPDHITPAREEALLAGMAGFLAACLLAFVLFRFDPRVKASEQAAGLYNLPVLATIPRDRRINDVSADGAELSSGSREGFRDLRVSLDLSAPDRHFRSLLVTSAGEGEGKSTVALNLAIALAERGRRTALVDADLRRGSLAARLGVAPRPGLTDAVVELASPIAVRRGLRMSPGSPIDEISVYPGGAVPPNPAAVLESEAFHALLRLISTEHDVVVIDTPPIATVSDALLLMRSAEAIILVTRAATTDRRAARRASELLARVPGANLAGVVVNDVLAGDEAVFAGRPARRFGGRARDLARA